jgi:Bacterial Ig domain
MANSAGPHPTLPGKAKTPSAHSQQNIWEQHTMTHAVRSCILTFSLAVLSAGPAFTQTQSSEASLAATVSAADVAHVYVGTATGVYLYDAASNGKLTLVSGSPFKTAGVAIGSNGKYFITLGTNYVHSYAIASNGAIGEQMSKINTHNYTGSDCGSPTGAILDHTGQNLYVQWNQTKTAGVCIAYQTFDIAKASGALTFHAAAVHDDTDFFGRASGFAITGNNQFAYAPNAFDGSFTTLSALRRESDGTLQFTNINETDPPSPYPDLAPNQPQDLTADPTNHLAVALNILDGDSVNLASYTVDAQGNVASTNNLDNMPIDEADSTAMQMSPTGKLLALASNYDYPTLQVFNFNGADPITPHSGQLKHPLVLIDQIQWDNNDHLYALNDSTKKLYVYTVTPNTIAEAPGSPYTIASPNRLNGLLVVSNLCDAPASDGVNICLPANGSSVSSPVLVEATAKVAGTIANTQLWVDGVKKYNAASNSLGTSVSLTAGVHRFAVVATNSSGQKWESAVYATVQ